MVKITALKIRQSFGSVLKSLQKSNEPLLIEKDRQPVAVLLSLKLFNEKFVDLREEEKKQALLNAARNHATEAKENSLQVLREMRYGPDH